MSAIKPAGTFDADCTKVNGQDIKSSFSAAHHGAGDFCDVGVAAVVVYEFGYDAVGGAAGEGAY